MMGVVCTFSQKSRGEEASAGEEGVKRVESKLGATCRECGQRTSCALPLHTHALWVTSRPDPPR